MIIQSQTATNISALMIVQKYYQQTWNSSHDDIIILTMLMFQHLDDVNV